MTAGEWVEALAGELGVEPPTQAETEELLALASVAAHASERTAAPVSCWLAARAGLPPGEVRRLAAAMTGEGV